MMKNLLMLANDTPQSPFLLNEDAIWTFRQVADLALLGAAWLQSIGVVPGDRVVIAVGNRPLFLFYWFAVIARGATAVPISPEMFGDSLRYVVAQSEASLVLTDGAELDRIMLEMAGTATPVRGFDCEATFVTAVSALTPLAPQCLDDGFPISILYTSGTTGLPKGVINPNRSYLATGAHITRAIGITAEDRILTFLPLHHANPQMYALMAALTVGCSVILVSKFSASSFAAQVTRYRATGFTYVGTVLSILARTLSLPLLPSLPLLAHTAESAQYNGPSTTLKWCVGGGAPCDAWEVLRQRLGVTIFELYGMTETGGMATMNTRAAYRFGSVGTARDDIELAVLDDNDERLPADVIGEIVLRPKSPYIMTTGYFLKPQETLDAMRNLWFHTGDFGRIDADGYLFFTGRKKELIRRGGEMISPAEIELAALKHPAVADCAAVGVKDVVLDEEIKLVVVRQKTATDLSANDIVAYLRTQLAHHKVPRYIEFVLEIPKTATQKVQRFKLAAHSLATIDMKAPQKK